MCMVLCNELVDEVVTEDLMFLSIKRHTRSNRKAFLETVLQLVPHVVDRLNLLAMHPTHMFTNK